MSLAERRKDSAYKRTQFKLEQIASLDVSITLKVTEKASMPYVDCLV